MQRLVGFEETVPVTMSTTEGYFSNDFVFSSDDGLRFAFGITSYDGVEEPIDDPSYGQIIAQVA